MNRLLTIVATMVLGLLILVPVAAAADPFYEDGRFIVSIGNDSTFPAGQRADIILVIDGTATIEGDARTVFVVNGTANIAGARVDEVVAIRSHVALDATSIVSGDVRTIQSTVAQAAGATLQGQVVDGLDLVAGAWYIGPFLLLAYVGFVVAAMVAAVGLAGLASRQVRAAEELIRREPGTVLLAAFAGMAAIITAAILAIVTVIGIPLGLGILIGFLPALAFVGYLVTGIWLGELLLQPAPGSDAPRRPYRAAILGVAILGVVGLIPGVGGLLSLVGLGAVVLLTWRTLRSGTGIPAATVNPASVPAAG